MNVSRHRVAFGGPCGSQTDGPCLGAPPTPERNGHSAKVEIWLLLNGSTLRVSQLGPDFLILNQPDHYPPGIATLILSIDDHERRWEVRLPEGLSPGRRRVPIASIQNPI